MSEQLKFADIKVGDKVVTDERGDWRMVTVSHVTAKQFDAGRNKFRKSDGLMMGALNRYYAYHPTDTIDRWGKRQSAQSVVEEQQAERERSALARQLRTFLSTKANHRFVTLEQLQAAADALGYGQKESEK